LLLSCKKVSCNSLSNVLSKVIPSISEMFCESI
jgi:hypothetical protein